jgi:AraC family transcriptional regulator
MVLDLASGCLRPADPDLPVLSSSSGPWSGALLEVHHGSPQPRDLRDVAPPGHVVLVHTGTATVCEWRTDGPYQSRRWARGQTLFLPAMAPWSFRAANKPDYVALTLDRTYVQCAAHELFPQSDRIEWRHGLPVADPLVGALVLALKAEAEGGYVGGTVYGEALATALVVQLVRRFSSAKPQGAPVGASLSRQVLRRVVEHVQEHLGDELTLNDLATTAGLSPFHFARLFKNSTGQAPHQYIIQRRIERARDLLLTDGPSAAEIALAAGFCDQSHLTAHFKRVFGVTPRQFRQRAGNSKPIRAAAGS